MSSNFEVDRDKLMEDVSHGLKQILSSLDDLNRNLESVNTIGKEFEAPANVWHQFHTSVMTPDSPPPPPPPPVAAPRSLHQDGKSQSSRSIQSHQPTHSPRSVRTSHSTRTHH